MGLWRSLQRLKELKELVEEVGRAIERRQPGADVQGARTLLSQAAAALERGDIKEAYVLTQEADAPLFPEQCDEAL